MAEVVHLTDAAWCRGPSAQAHGGRWARARGSGGPVRCGAVAVPVRPRSCGRGRPCGRRLPVGVLRGRQGSASPVRAAHPDITVSGGARPGRQTGKSVQADLKRPSRLVMTARPSRTRRCDDVRRCSSSKHAVSLRPGRRQQTHRIVPRPSAAYSARRPPDAPSAVGVSRCAVWHLEGGRQVCEGARVAVRARGLGRYRMRAC